MSTYILHRIKEGFKGKNISVFYGNTKG